jgi:hypothetical protein
MNAPSLSAQLRCELVRRRLPRFYVHRVMREFDDHSQDIVAERQETPDADRLGDPRQLAQHFATEFRARHFAGRHPWLVFLLAPIPCTLVAVIASFFMAFATVELLEPVLPAAAAPWLSRFLMIAACHVGLVVPLLGVTWIFGRLAYRSGCGARWFWTASLLQCLLGALTQLSVSLPAERTNGSIEIGLSYPPAMNWEFFALPALVAVGLAWHVSRRVDTAPLATE